MSNRICVVAIGGNAIITENCKGSIEEQIENIRIACTKIVELIKGGYRVIITHGNGPQVGQALLRHKLAAAVVSEGSLDSCGAETQGLLGYLIQQALRNELFKAGIYREVTAVVTQVLVDQEDPAFHNPTKPIGPFYTKEEAQALAEKYDKHIVEDSGRGYRMVVPSPMPMDIMEKNAILSLVETGSIVIAVGGGGIPVVRKNGELYGVEAVIDKDLASGVLAKLVGADYLLLLTGVEKVCINFNKPDQKQLDVLTVMEAEQYLGEGQFPEGSMAPKIRAGIDFVKSTGGKTVITTLNSMCEALEGRTGTVVVVDREAAEEAVA